MSSPIIQFAPITGKDVIPVTVEGFGREQADIKVAHTGYAVTVGSFEWEVTAVFSARQDGRTAWLVSLAMIDGDITTRSGLDATEQVHEVVNRAICQLTQSWTHPANQ